MRVARLEGRAELAGAALAVAPGIAGRAEAALDLRVAMRAHVAAPVAVGVELIDVRDIGTVVVAVDEPVAILVEHRVEVRDGRAAQQQREARAERLLDAIGAHRDQPGVDERAHRRGERAVVREVERDHVRELLQAGVRRVRRALDRGLSQHGAHGEEVRVRERVAPREAHLAAGGGEHERGGDELERGAQLGLGLRDRVREARAARDEALGARRREVRDEVHVGGARGDGARRQERAQRERGARERPGDLVVVAARRLEPERDPRGHRQDEGPKVVDRRGREDLARRVPRRVQRGRLHRRADHERPLLGRPAERGGPCVHRRVGRGRSAVARQGETEHTRDERPKASRAHHAPPWASRARVVKHCPTAAPARKARAASSRARAPAARVGLSGRRGRAPRGRGARRAPA